jgi:MYND finger
LEAKGRFLEAARVYHDVSNGLSDGRLSNGDGFCNQTNAKSFAGLAYKRAGNFDEAEKLYVSALWSDVNHRCAPPKTWDVNEKYTYALLTNIMQLMYASMAEHGGQVTAMDFCTFPYVGLLFAAGFSSDQLHFLEHGPTALTQLKAQASSPKKKALRSLRALGESTKVEDFRAKLHSYLKPNARGQNSKIQLTFNGTYDRKDNAKMDKRAARDQVASSLTAGYNYRNECSCNNPTCTGTHDMEKLLCCPCKKVLYCCKECQVAHWKAHKTVCPTRKGKSKK